MKPCIFWYLGRWWCHTASCTKDGDTPREAYFKWFAWVGVGEVTA